MSKDLNIKLCRPDHTTIYSLNDIIGPKYHEVYNGINTLTFEVPYYITDYTGTQFKNPVIDLIKPFYLLFYKEQYFIIDLPTQSSTETTDKLNVQAYGLGYQLGNKRIRNFSTGTVATPVMNLEDTANAILGKATIRFTPTTITTTGMPFDFNIGDIITIDGCSVTANNTTATITAIDTNKYMLTCAASSFTSATEIVNVEITNGIDTYINGVTLSGWKVGTVDAGIRLLYRAIEISDSSLLESINNLCEVWDCIAKYDTINRLINFVDYKTDGFFDGLVISQARYMKSIETDKINDLTTKLHVYGVNDLSINAVNPNGQNYITDYTYVKNTDYMSQDMIDNLELYENTLENSQGQFTGYLDNKVSYQANLLTKQNELDFLINEVDNGKTALELKIDIAIANGDSTTALKAQLAIREGLIDDKNAEIAAVEAQIAAVDTQISILQTSLDISNFLSSEEVSLLNDLTFESAYVDTNITALGNSTSTLMLLMEEAKKQLALVSTPRFSAKINIIDFLHSENSTYDKDKLKIGNIVKVRHPDLGIYLDVKIVDIEQDFDNFGLNIVVANTKSLKDGFTKGQSLLRSVSSMNGMLSVNANSWSNGGAAGTIVNDYINNAINTTKQTILGGVNNSVQINERGITIIDPVEPQYVQRFTAGAWGMSSDGGENFRVGASKGTIYADTIVGELVVAQNGVFDSLIVYNDDSLKVCEIGKYLDGVTEKYGIRINSGSLIITDSFGSSQTFEEVLSNILVGISQIFYSATAPIVDMNYKDFWIDIDKVTPPDKTCIYRYEDENGKDIGIMEWRTNTEIQNDALGLLYLENYNTKTTAEKSRTYVQNDPPTSGMAVGDLWLDSNDKYKVYRYDGLQWVLSDNSLKIGTEYNRVKIDSTGLTVTGESAVGNTLIKLNKDDGFCIYKGAEKTVGIDSLGNAFFKGAITATSGSFKGIVDASDFRINGTSVLNGGYIDGDYIDTINANKINGGTITGVTINVDTNCTIGNKLFIDGTNVGAGIQWTTASYEPEIYIESVTKAMFLSTGGSGAGIYANNRRIDVDPIAKFG